jgi:hypothetical protein
MLQSTPQSKPPSENFVGIVLCTSISLVDEKNRLTTIIGLRTVNMSKILLTQEHIYIFCHRKLWELGLGYVHCTVIKPKCLSSAFVGNGREGGGCKDFKELYKV